MSEPNEKDKNLEPIKMWELGAGGYCGFLLDTKTMRRIINLQIDYESKMRDILNDNIESIVAYSWTMSTPAEGRDCKYVYYRDKYSTKEARIKLFSATRPKRVDFYDTTSSEEAKVIAEQLAKEAHDE